MLKELSNLIDQLEEKYGEDNDIYCEFAYDYQNIVDDIRSLTRRANKVLTDRKNGMKINSKELQELVEESITTVSSKLNGICEERVLLCEAKGVQVHLVTTSEVDMFLDCDSPDDLCITE